MTPLCLAVDIGGTKVSVGAVDEEGKILASERCDTPVGVAEPEELMGRIEELIAKTRALHEVAVCGVGCGGPMTRGGETVSPINIPSWRDFPLRECLLQATGLPVFIDNDAKALALAEWWLGAARGCDNFLAMVVSTGVGGGLVVDGRLLDGNSGNAGHIGHMIVEPEGPRCGCGARGCLEAVASGTAIRASSGRDPASAPPETVRQVGVMVGRGIASVSNLVDVALVVIAGSVALGFGEPFFEAARTEARERARTCFTRDLQILPAGLGAAGPLIGAAAVGFKAIGAPGPWERA